MTNTPGLGLERIWASFLIFTLDNLSFKIRFFFFLTILTEASESIILSHVPWLTNWLVLRDHVFWLTVGCLVRPLW